MESKFKTTDDSKWQIDRSISITHIITTISAIAAVVIFGSNLQTHQEVTAAALASAVISQRSVDQKQDDETATLRKATREDLQKINDKLDTLILRMVK